MTVDKNSEHWAAIHSAVVTKSNPEHHAFLIAWCEQYADAELDISMLTPREAAQACLRAYLNNLLERHKRE